MARILVVDSSRFFRARIRRVLQDQGHEVIEAHDLHEAARELFVHVPDGVVLDMLSIEDHRLSLLEDLRRRSFDGPVVVVTADQQAMTRHLAISHGATAVLHEPIEASELLSLIAESETVA